VTDDNEVERKWKRSKNVNIKLTANMLIDTNRKLSPTRSTRVAYSDVHRLLEGRYMIGNTIGEGPYSKVKVAYKFEKSYPRKVACKEINKARISWLRLHKFLPRELSIIRTLDHPHIITVYDTMDLQESVFIFMEICEGGTLLEFIQDKGPLKDCKARHFFR
jgi:serine/threonine protein kinase